jgi:hypothetical protein
MIWSGGVSWVLGTNRAIIMKMKSQWGLGVQNGTDPMNESKRVESSVIINQFTYGVHRLHIWRGRERERVMYLYAVVME